MNLVSLVTQGLSGISVFVSEVFVRFIGLSLVMVALCVAASVVSVAMRLFTGPATPGGRRRWSAHPWSSCCSCSR